MTEHTQITGNDGKATFNVPYGDYVATIIADGYALKEESIAFRSNHKNFTIQLISSTPTYTITFHNPMGNFNGTMQPTGSTENNRVEYKINTSSFNDNVWLDEDAVADGVTHNYLYMSSTSAKSDNSYVIFSL